MYVYIYSKGDNERIECSSSFSVVFLDTQLHKQQKSTGIHCRVNKYTHLPTSKTSAGRTPLPPTSHNIGGGGMMTLYISRGMTGTELAPHLISFEKWCKQRNIWDEHFQLTLVYCLIFLCKIEENQLTLCDSEVNVAFEGDLMHTQGHVTVLQWGVGVICGWGLACMKIFFRVSMIEYRNKK